MKEIFSSFSSEKVDYVAFNISLIVVIAIASFILLSPGAAENFIGTLKNQVIDFLHRMKKNPNPININSIHCV